MTYRQMSMDGGADMDNKRTAMMFKAFCDENRLRILQVLRGGERCACNRLEEMHITQPTLSHHMKILCDAGIVVSRKEGKWMHYSISKEGIDTVRECLNQFAIHSDTENEKPCCKK